MLDSLKLVAGGLKSYAPFLSSFRGTGGTTSSRYCYAVWLRHFTLIRDGGLGAAMESIVELGPGDSIGVGIAALLSGMRRYTALDVVEHADINTNLAVFEELVDLFRRREPIPGDREFPGVHPRLESDGFPFHHLSESRLAEALHPERLARIRACIDGSRPDPGLIRYVCPWYRDSLPEDSSADLIFSQAALHEMDNVEWAYAVMSRLLKPNGIMSHQIEMSFPASHWNQHWSYSDSFWKLVRGNRPSYFNRLPYSAYLELTRRHGHTIRHTLAVKNGLGLPKSKVSPRFRDLSDGDFSISSAYVLSTKN
jgi:hypothetical protein